VAALSEGGSNSVAVAVPVTENAPAPVNVTVRVTLALAPLASPPRLQVIVVVPEQDPELAFADESVTLEGSGIEKLTPLAAFGPLLVTVNVAEASLPKSTGFGKKFVALTAKSAILVVPFTATPAIAHSAAALNPSVMVTDAAPGSLLPEPLTSVELLPLSCDQICV
jgi:hypothetical protein